MSVEQTFDRLRELAGFAAETAGLAFETFGEVALPMLRGFAWSLPGGVDEMSISTHVIVAGATAGACAVADAFVTPEIGLAVELVGGAAVAGIAVSAVCVSLRRSGVTHLRRRALVAAAAADVREAHQGVLAAGALYGASCVALGKLRPAACVGAATHLARATALRFVSNPLGRVPVLGLALQVGDATKAAVNSARFVRDVELAAERIMARHAALPQRAA